METVFCLIGFSGDDPNFCIGRAGFVTIWGPRRRKYIWPDIWTCPLTDAGCSKTAMLSPSTLQVTRRLSNGRSICVTTTQLSGSYTPWNMGVPMMSRTGLRHEAGQCPPIPEDLEDIKPVVKVTSDEPKCEPTVPQSDSEDLPSFARKTIEVWSPQQEDLSWLVGSSVQHVTEALLEFYYRKRKGAADPPGTTQTRVGGTTEGHTRIGVAQGNLAEPRLIST